jgi:hypothetical protein
LRPRHQHIVVNDIIGRRHYQYRREEGGKGEP